MALHFPNIKILLVVSYFLFFFKFILWELHVQTQWNTILSTLYSLFQLLPILYHQAPLPTLCLVFLFNKPLSPLVLPIYSWWRRASTGAGVTYQWPRPHQWPRLLPVATPPTRDMPLNEEWLLLHQQLAIANRASLFMLKVQLSWSCTGLLQATTNSPVNSPVPPPNQLSPTLNLHALLKIPGQTFFFLLQWRIGISFRIAVPKYYDLKTHLHTWKCSRMPQRSW